MLLNDEFINSFNELSTIFVKNFLDFDDFDDDIRSPLYDELFSTADLKQKYKKDISKKFTRLSYGALTKDADHGIFSALLFLNAAKQMGGNFIKPRSTGDDKNELYRDDIMDIALAIFSHNTLDRSKAPGHKWHLATKDRNAKLDGKLIKFDFSVFCYNIYKEVEKKEPEKKKIDNWLASLLILCDSFSQWGRKMEEGDDKNSAYLVPRSDENTPNVCLCYPMLNQNEAHEKLEQFYAPQICTILANPSEENFFQIYVNPSNTKCPMRSHGNDTSKCLTSGGIDSDCISIDTQKKWSIRNKPDSKVHMHQFDKEDQDRRNIS